MKKIAEKSGTLLEALESFYPDSSKRTLRNWLKAGRISIEGKTLNLANHPIEKGQEIEISDAKRIKTCEVPILYEDEHLVIINKPDGMLSVPLDSSASTNALQILREYYDSKNIFAVHRIDRETSGVLVFAKSQKAREGMDELFKNHDLIREYEAIVEGNLNATKGKWKSRLIEPTPYKVRSTMNSKEGKIAITHYEVVHVMKNTTFLRLTLETGRKHQIRIHCQEAGHPILGDKRYGSTNNHYNRVCLHAHRISFTHPITKQLIDVKAPTIGFMKQVKSTTDLD